MKMAITEPIRPRLWNGDGVGERSVAAVASPIAKVVDRADAGSPVANAAKSAVLSAVPNIVDPPDEPVEAVPPPAGACEQPSSNGQPPLANVIALVPPEPPETTKPSEPDAPADNHPLAVNTMGRYSVFGVA